MGRTTQERVALGLVRQFWRWGAGLLSFAVAVAGSELLTRSETMTEVASAVVSSVAWAVIVLAVGVFFMWCGFTGWRILPAQRLRARADLIDDTMDALESDHPERENPDYGGPPTRTASRTKSLLHQTIHALDKLKVGHPPFDYPVNPWLVYLSRLSAAARVGDLKRARNIWNEMEKERRQREE